MEIDIKGKTAHEILEFLEHNSDVQSNETYFRPFDQAELDDSRRQHADLCLKLEDKNKAFAEAKKEHADVCKDIKQDIAETLTSVRRRGREETGRCYTFKDAETKTVTTYNRFGMMINRRAMTPEEKQMTIDEGVNNVRRMAVNQ